MENEANNGTKKRDNSNHPIKGSSIVVEPIREEKDIIAIRNMLSDNPRNHLLFVLGINNGLRTGDLLKLRVKDLAGMKPGDSINIREGNETIFRFLVFKPIFLQFVTVIIS
jgi:integrase